ncbi:hypothetical protein J1614_006686 [Plenodomus biglobosus]|nr:hypothetical protein J1614_006686 [Plenodomus biglobosus]
MQQQQEGAWWRQPQPKPSPAQQARPSPSQPLYAPTTPIMFQSRQPKTVVSNSPPGALGWSGSTIPYPGPGQYYGSPPARPPAMGVSQKSASGKRSTDDLAGGVMPTPKRQAVPALMAGTSTSQGSPERVAWPAPDQQPRNPPPYPPRDPRIMAWAQQRERAEYESTSSQGKAIEPRQRQERVEAIYHFAFQKKRAVEANQRKEQFHLAHIEAKRIEDEKTQKEEEAAEQLRVKQALEEDRLAQIEIARRQEKAHQEEEQRKAAHAALAAQKELREQFECAEDARKQRQEAAQIEAAAALERQRRAERKAELQRDPNRNFHSYFECLEYWPFPKDERQNTYMRMLLANQLVPLCDDTDTAVAIKYAKKHWYLYRQYPRDIAVTAQDAKAEEEKESAANKKAHELWKAVKVSAPAPGNA